MTIQVTKPGMNPYLKSLIFGPYGQGKTTLLGTAQHDPRTWPMFFLSFEGGESSLAGLDIDVVRIRSWDDYNQAYRFLASGKHGYKSVGVDSISETHVFALLNLAAQRGGLSSGTKDLISGEVGNGTGDKYDPDQFQQQDYGKAKVQLMKLLRAFRDLPMHVFFTALSKDQLDTREGTVKVPALSGSLPDELPGIMDAVSYLALRTNEDGTVSRVLVLKNYPKIRTKVRTGWGQEVPDEIEDPTLTKLMDALQIPNPAEVTGQ